MKMGAEFWVAHVAAAKLEALPTSAYARRHSISLSALYYWQRKLKKSGTSVQTGKFIALRLAATGPRQNNPKFLS